MMRESVAHDLSQTANRYPLTISLFGHLRIFVNGKLADPFRLNKSRALLAYLLVENTKPLLRTDLAELFWPGYTAESARVNLRQALGDLRTLLERFELLQHTRAHITLQTASPSLWCDVLQFQSLMSRWQAHPHRALADCPSCQADLQQAVALTTGGFLDQLPDIGSPPFAAWLQRQRRHFADQVATAQAALADLPQPGNLRPALTTLIGRGSELAELQEKIAHPTYRCVTLVGPGGIGKTRLALAVGEQQKANFPDGVWLVELSAPATSPAPAAPAAETAEQAQDRLATAIGATLSITFQGAAHPHEQLAAHLRDKTLLLLLDNFELVSAGADLLPQLLAAAPHLRLLVNSRQRLPLHAQVIYAVEGLATPPAAAAGAPDTLTTYAGVQLFIERARNAGFSLPHDGPTLTAIGALCRLVHGSPWAIELAVALLDRYTPAALLDAIAVDYRALTGGWLDLPPRLRSAEAVLRTMWELLIPHEATGLAHCAIFRGGFTATASQVISTVSAADLQALVDKSLLHLVSDGRFTLHELMRQFAAEQLARNDAEQVAVATRHAAYYMALLQSQGTALLNSAKAYDIIQTELDNLRAAWQWSVAQGDLALLAMGVHGFFTYYGLAGLYHEAIQQLENTFVRLRPLHAAAPTDTAMRRLLACLLTHAAEFYQRTGALATSEQMAEEALSLGQELADSATQAFTYHVLTHVALARNHLPTAQALAEAGCTQARLAQRPDLLSECLNDLGIALILQQQPLAAAACFEEALHTLTGVTNHYLEVLILTNLGQVQLFHREYELARRYLQRVNLLNQMLRDQDNRVYTYWLWGTLWMGIGLYEAAKKEYQQAQALLQITPNPYWSSWLQINEGYLHHLCGDDAVARDTLCRQTAQQTENRLFESLALLYLGYMLLDGAEWRAAQACFEQCLAFQSAEPWIDGAADVHTCLATCLLAQGETAVAIQHVDTALDLLAQQGVSIASELFSVYWLCFQALQAVGDGRAQEVLQTAYQQLQHCANQFEDPALRHAFLNNVVVNRHLVNAAQAAGLVPA